MNSNKNQKDRAFETHVREQLQQRTLEPSAQAWDRLDSMLTVAETPRKSFRWWYAVAAIFILGGLVGLWNWQQKVLSVDDSTTVVLEDVPADKKSIAPEKHVEVKLPEVTQEQKVEVVSGHQVKTLKLVNDTTNNDLVTVQKLDLSAIQGKVIDLSSTELEYKLDAEVAEKCSLSVDPLKLLNAVEKEVEIQHRNKVIESINKNYQTVKQALATRNLE